MSMTNIKAAVFDIDGTLLPQGRTEPSRKTFDAVEKLRKKGVKVIIATGRAQPSGEYALGGMQADYYLYNNGALVLDENKKTVFESRMTPEEMYALVDFCEDYALPLNFAFSDATYVYEDYESFRAMYGPYSSAALLRNGEDQVRHLINMPFSAGAILPQEKIKEFEQKYGYLGLRFVSFHGNNCDIMRIGVNKAVSLMRLLKILGMEKENIAAFGDGGNDIELLELAGFAVAMENGSDELKKAADIIAPPCIQDGAAQIIEKYIL